MNHGNQIAVENESQLLLVLAIPKVSVANPD